MKPEEKVKQHKQLQKNILPKIQALYNETYKVYDSLSKEILELHADSTHEQRKTVDFREELRDLKEIFSWAEKLEHDTSIILSAFNLSAMNNIINTDILDIFFAGNNGLPKSMNVEIDKFLKKTYPKLFPLIKDYSLELKIYRDFIIKHCNDSMGNKAA